MTIAPVDAAGFYPDSDGKPMAETPIHRDVMTDRCEDQKDQLRPYRDILAVPEYFFLFDPLSDYLDPPLQGHRLDPGGANRPIEPVNGRLPSKILDLHLERIGRELRPFDPVNNRLLPTRLEAVVIERTLRERMEAERGRTGEEIEQFKALIERLTAVVELRDTLLAQKEDTILNLMKENVRLLIKIEELESAKKPKKRK